MRRSCYRMAALLPLLLALISLPSIAATTGQQNPYQKWLDEDVRWIITRQERAQFLLLTTDVQRDRFVVDFWVRHDPTPGTPENEFKEEHYRRLAYSNEHFAAGVPGWETDRGHTYIVYGPPDQIDTNLSPTHGSASLKTTRAAYPYQVWHYRHIDGIGKDVTVKFVDTCMCGDYRKVDDPSLEHPLP
jgi:GWxTD domain-containing protein